jgi:hypothetical protein
VAHRSAKAAVTKLRPEQPSPHILPFSVASETRTQSALMVDGIDADAESFAMAAAVGLE